MAMTIMNDASAAMTLGELNKNISELGKQLKRVSSGMRINGAGDGPSEFSISEKMRVRIRALDQDERNVLNGAALLRTAEGAIQSQIEIMKTIKQKVIDADNDTNTDLDRMTIQKEIDQGYQQIEDIAQETNYNGKRLLVGDKVSEVIRSWIVMNYAVLQPDSDDLKLINGTLSKDGSVSYDGTKYAKFNEWREDPCSLNTLGLNETNNFTGGKTESTPKTITFDLSTANFTNLMDYGIGVGFSVKVNRANLSLAYTPEYFVLTTDGSETYKTVISNKQYTATNIVVNPSMTKEQIASAMVSGINATLSSKGYANLMEARSDGTKVIIETKAKSSTNVNGYVDTDYENYSTAGGFGCVENPNEKVTTSTTEHQNKTGQFSTSGNGSRLRDGAYAVVKTPDQPDVQEKPAIPDTLTADVSSAPDGSGVRISGPSGSAKLTFVSGDSSFSGGNNGTIGKNFNGTFNIAGISVTMNGSGKITFSTPYDGNNYYVKDGLSQTTTTTETTVSVKRVDRLTAGSGSIMGAGAGYESVNAAKSLDIAGTCEINLSFYATLSETEQEKLEDFIKDVKGKIITWNYPSSISNGTSKYNNRSQSYTFIDTGGDNISPTMEALNPPRPPYQSRSIDIQPTTDAATVFDLNELRGRLVGNKTAVEVVTAWLKEKFGERILTQEDKVLFQSQYKGNAGNSDTLKIYEGNLRSYEIDFATKLAGKSIPEDLDGRGFRMYCATHQGQWFNFEFVNGMDSLDDKPLSGTDALDIKTFLIDVSNVHNANELVEAIYDQTMKDITGQERVNGKLYWNHYMRVAADNENGKLIVYDERAYNVADPALNLEYQPDGAKLADGIMDNVVKGKRNVYVKDLVIQHTDHASQNIHVWVPQTSLDHLFGYVPGEKKPSDFNVLTAQSRELLLGNKVGTARNGRVVTEEEKGYLDTALDYLTSANTLVGAQIMRLEMTQANIVTSRESTMNSESTIRDADMAKEMTEYTKANVLAQAAQSMLAQANQNSSSTLNLLQ